MSVQAMIEVAERRGRYDEDVLVVLDAAGVRADIEPSGFGFSAYVRDEVGHGSRAYGRYQIEALTTAFDGYLDILNHPL